MVDPGSLDVHQLTQRLPQVDSAVREALSTRYPTPVCSLAMYMLKQPALAEEVTQDIFLNIWLKASSFNAERGQPRGWIMSVAHHKIIDLIRSRKRTIVNTDPADYETLDLLPDGGVSTEAQVEQSLERERIMRALKTIPENQREVIMLAYFGGLSQSEMAEKLDQPLGTIKTRVRLAMQKLRTVLENDGYE
ncbi:MAG: sigma-70 family RNA polymerase sigma factor [Chloroflexi bacterium]|nr:sigma-70 family RNA polymerase sigma factor [Chloroflexota bacterium]